MQMMQILVRSSKWKDWTDAEKMRRAGIVLEIVEKKDEESRW